MRSLLALFLTATLLAGCTSESASDPQPPADADPLPPLGEVLLAEVTTVANFTESVVGAAVAFAADLYEPTIDVSGSGVIYITGHTIAADTTGAPAYFSRDDGATWSQLPFAGPAALPIVHGGTPPPSDELFFAAGDDGWVFGVDITLATYPVNGWSGDGAQLAYHNPNAYPEGQNAQQAADCRPLPLKDRPWAAYENGTLLMVSNPGGGPAQVGVMQVPPMLPAGATGAVFTQWNLCAGPGGSIPGIPDIRADGTFAVPQRSGGALTITLGHKGDVMGTRTVDAFPLETFGEITSVYGVAAFDADGTLFVGISNNTEAGGKEAGQMAFAVWTEDGNDTFAPRTVKTGTGPLRHFYMDANENGPGALVVWAVDGDSGYDWYTGHLQLAHDGAPVLENVALAIDEGPEPSAHVTGAAVGPDGRAYLAMYRGVAPGGNPLSVYVQQTGPALPVAAAA